MGAIVDFVNSHKRSFSNEGQNVFVVFQSRPRFNQRWKAIACTFPRRIINKLDLASSYFMEAVFLIQPWVQANTARDCCKLCYQERAGKAHLECKRAHLAACNSLLAVLKLEKGPEFEDALKRVQEAKEKCLSSANPDEHCHRQSQEALAYTLGLYDKVINDYRKRLPSKAPKL